MNLRRTSFLRYSTELAVVFFGVWFGLLAENYRESRQERAQERVSLARLIQDLETDHFDMTGNLERTNLGLAAAMWLVEHADTDSPDRDSVGHYLGQLQNISVLSLNTSEYSALKSAGRINVIKDVALRQDLTRLYESYPYIQGMHEMDNHEVFKAMDRIAPYFRQDPSNETPFWPVRVVGDPAAILSDGQFLRSLTVMASIRGILQAEYVGKLREVEDLQARARASLGGIEEADDT